MTKRTKHHTDETATAITVDAKLVERYLMDLARFGAWGETGVSRTTYSPEWVAAADQYDAWCQEAGLTTWRDAVGNVWGRLEGTDPGPSIVTGSHLDSQTPGGRYDGALGIIGGLVALKTLRERFGQPRRTVETVALCEEESSRFAAANFWGSRAITGAIGADEPNEIRGYDGTTIGEAMREIGLDPDQIPSARRDDIGAYIELHIEQGPILEHADLPVAVVSAITGIRHYVVELRGTSNHAGAFPMDLRRDPMAGAAEIISGVINTAHRLGRPAVTTVGRMHVEPNFPAIVPETVTFTVDARHPDPAAREALYARHEALIREVADRRDLHVSWRHTVNHNPCLCDPDLMRTFQTAAERLELPYLTMPSGAAHDAQQMALICPVAMLFIRSQDGRSHTPDEFSTPDDVAAGVQLLTAGLYDLAY